MKIGLISDSHDHLDNIRKCVEIFQREEVSYVLHIGDFISPNAIRACEGIRLKAVFGNNDGDEFRLVSAFNAIGGEIKGGFYEFEEEGIKFACYHGTEPELKDALIECGKYDVVIYGHTHNHRNEQVGGTLVLNPGTSHGFGNGATVMIFDTDSRTASLIEL